MNKLAQFAFATALAFLAFLPGQVKGQEWASDQIHSSVNFQVRHALTPMLGRFNNFNVDLVWNEEDLENSSVLATLDPGSIYMGSADLEGHLRGPDFFDVDNSGQWSFKSSSISQDGEGSFVAAGELTVRGVTKEVEIPFQLLGKMETRWGNKVGIAAEFTLDRTEYGINYDPEGKMIGKDIKIMVFLEMNEKKG